MPDQTYLIVGASLAGASAAAALRTEGFEGRIVLVGEEPEPPYERPELSKKYLRGEREAPKWVKPEGFYTDARIELRSGERALRVDPERREVVTTAGTQGYDRLLLATGSAPRRLDVPGGELEGIVTLRTIEDADAIRERARTAGSVVVVGGGWIGSEVAASLRQLGCAVTMVSPTRAPLERVLGAEVADVYRRVHEEHGVTLVTGAFVAGFTGVRSVESVVTADGRTVPADLVVVGVGAVPRTELALEAGLEVDGGVVVDQRLRTSAPDIYAAGDVASAWHPFYGRRLRVEHWDNAKRQGQAAAATMAGRETAYDRIPYFYSDQYDVGMEYTGHATAWDQVVLRGDPAAREFIAFWLSGGHVVAGMNVNTWDVAPAIEGLIRSGRRVDPARLADPSAPLEEVAAAA